MMNSRVGVRLAKHSLATALILAYSSIGFAQVTASMTGKVEDPSGAAIAETNVTVTSLETGAARTVTSDQTGNYSVLSLAVGRYEVRAEKPGFKAAIQTGINLAVGQRYSRNFSACAGDMPQTRS